MAADFDEYVRQRGASLQRLAYLLVGDRHEAEDLLQGVLARLFVRWSAVERADNVDAYVRAALANAAASWWRARFRRRDVPVATVPEVAGSSDTSESRDEIVDMLRKLPPRQRAVIVLRYYEDRTEAEIASILGCSTGTVKSQATKARATLRGLWADNHQRSSEQLEEIS